MIRTSRQLSIRSALANCAALTPSATAVAAPGRKSLSFAGLLKHIDEVIAALNDVGLGPNSRVAVVLRNGPESATCFLSVASAATYVPMNPNWRSREYQDYLSDVGAEALIVESGVDSPAIGVANNLGLAMIELLPAADGPAGLFQLKAKKSPASRAKRLGLAGPNDVALLMPTSGTTSRSKLVPLPQANLCTSAANIAKAFSLGPFDRCLNVMPLFHIHGLIAAVLSSILSGGSVFCTPGFYAPRFFDWLAESEATWYTAVPTMHQAILMQSERRLDPAGCSALRFIRSCSAPLPPQVMQHLETAFRVPVVESYGMTEAAHQISSNPLPPLKRKLGSVGLPTGLEIAILDEAWELLPQGQLGEVALRGVTIAEEYENNSAATEANFRHGWFRTGDQGYLDEDGYLFLKGRLKELINRGGAKISPREIDEVLLSHPSIAEALTFALPHAQLGEDVGAAVVLRNGASETELGLREFVASQLADFKVPRRIIVVAEIPKGPTGKPQRIGLAERLGLKESDPAVHAPSAFLPTQSPLETTLAEIFAQVLGLPFVSANDNFFRLGGDSMLAAQLAIRVQNATGAEVSVIRLHGAPTVAELARFISNHEKRSPSLVALKTSGTGKPFFCVTPGAQIPAGFRHIADSLDRPFYALQPLDLLNADGVYDIRTAAAHYVAAIRSLQPTGSYLIGGHCSGSFAALEIARILRSEGEQVACLAIINPVKPAFYQRTLASHWQNLKALPLPDKAAYLARRAGPFASKLFRDWSNSSGIPQSDTSRLADTKQVHDRVQTVNRRAWRTDLRVPYAGAIDIFLAEGCAFSGLRPSLDPRIQWGKVASGGVRLHMVPGDHITLLTPPNVTALADCLRMRLRELDPDSRDTLPAVTSAKPVQRAEFPSTLQKSPRSV